jgi:hypothetical protein
MDESKNNIPVRFVATLSASTRSKALAATMAFDLDRLPDSNGEPRFLITSEDARRLVLGGFVVQLREVVPIAPLPKDLVMSDPNAQSWLSKLRPLSHLRET